MEAGAAYNGHTGQLFTVGTWVHGGRVQLLTSGYMGAGGPAAYSEYIGTGSSCLQWVHGGQGVSCLQQLIHICQFHC